MLALQMSYRGNIVLEDAADMVHVEREDSERNEHEKMCRRAG